MIKLDHSIPEWSLETILGEDVPKIKDYCGKPLLILIFNVGCLGCIGRAIPFANRMAYEYGERLNVVAIHSKIGNYDKSFFQKLKLDLFIRFPIFKDVDLDTTYSLYEAGGTPHWLLVDEFSHVKYSIFGSDPNNALLRLDLKIQELIQ